MRQAVKETLVQMVQQTPLLLAVREEQEAQVAQVELEAQGVQVEMAEA